MRKRGRVDGNQSDIVEAFRSMGATVAILSAVGSGVPDLLVGYAGQNALVECKVKGGKLTEAQIEFMQRWKGSVHIIRTRDEAYALIGAMAARWRQGKAQAMLNR